MYQINLHHAVGRVGLHDQPNPWNQSCCNWYWVYWGIDGQPEGCEHKYPHIMNPKCIVLGHQAISLIKTPNKGFPRNTGHSSCSWSVLHVFVRPLAFTWVVDKRSSTVKVISNKISGALESVSSRQEANLAKNSIASGRIRDCNLSPSHTNPPRGVHPNCGRSRWHNPL